MLTHRVVTTGQSLRKSSAHSLISFDAEKITNITRFEKKSIVYILKVLTFYYTYKFDWIYCNWIDYLCRCIVVWCFYNSSSSKNNTSQIPILTLTFAIKQLKTLLTIASIGSLCVIANHCITADGGVFLALVNVSITVISGPSWLADTSTDGITPVHTRTTLTLLATVNTVVRKLTSCQRQTIAESNIRMSMCIKGYTLKTTLKQITRIDVYHEWYQWCTFLASSCHYVCLFVWSLSSHSRIFHLFWDVTIVGEGLQILTYARHIWLLSSEGSLACHTYCDTYGPSVYNGISEDPWHSHIMPSVWQWSCQYLFWWLTGVAAGIRTPDLPLAERTLKPTAQPPRSSYVCFIYWCLVGFFLTMHNGFLLKLFNT